jgi:cytochrome c oxidase accessory protein FixG
VAKNAVFLLLSVVLGNVFLAYFVGVDALHRWVTSSPVEHPTPFIVMAVTSALVFFDFAYFREQMCTVICPYARIQSVLLDTRSLIVGYDARRGEPRTHGKPKAGMGDCIDCKACVVACPTGIDIRNGLQLECIACAQCADACDSIMTRIHKPLGLVRYGSQQSLEQGIRGRLLRPRVVIYPALLAVLLGALFVFGRRDVDMDVTVLRGLGAPFVLTDAGVTNQVRIKIENRSSAADAYRIELTGFPEARLVAPENPLRVATDSHETTSVFVIAPPSAFTDGLHAVGFRISDRQGRTRNVPYKLLGPTGQSSPRFRGAR